MSDIGRRTFLGALAAGACAAAPAAGEAIDNGEDPRWKRIYRLSALGIERVRMREVRAGDLLVFGDGDAWWSCVADADPARGRETGVWSVEARLVVSLTPAKVVPG